MNVQNSIASEFDKDLFDAYMKYADAMWNDMVERREYEWKVSFGLWTAMGVLAGFIFQKKIADYYHLPVGVLIATVGLVYTYCWTPGLRIRTIRNMRTAHQFWDKAEDCLRRAGGFHGQKSPRMLKSIKCEKKGRLPWHLAIYSHWATGAQVAFTWILIMIAILAIFDGYHSNCFWLWTGFALFVLFATCLSVDIVCILVGRAECESIESTSNPC